MAYKCIFLLFYFVLTTYQRASAVNSDKFLFVEQEKNLFTRKPSIIDFSSNSVNDNILENLRRHRRDINAISRSDSSLPRNISVQVSSGPLTLYNFDTGFSQIIALEAVNVHKSDDDDEIFIQCDVVFFSTLLPFFRSLSWPVVLYFTFFEC